LHNTKSEEGDQKERGGERAAADTQIQWSEVVIIIATGYYNMERI